MTKKQQRDLREQFGTDILIFKSQRQGFAYMDAVDAFARTGDRAALFRALLRLGVGGAARWHAEHRDEAMGWCC